MQTEETILAFIAAINAHEVDRILELCTEDHRFVDAHGGVVSGRPLRDAWSGYFAFMPHYGIEAETILCQGDAGAVFGWAWGGLEAADPQIRAWRRPCAWRAEVGDDRIELWQVYVDTKAVFDLL